MKIPLRLEIPKNHTCDDPLSDAPVLIYLDDHVELTEGKKMKAITPQVLEKLISKRRAPYEDEKFRGACMFAVEGEESHQLCALRGAE